MSLRANLTTAITALALSVPPVAGATGAPYDPLKIWIENLTNSCSFDDTPDEVLQKILITRERALVLCNQRNSLNEENLWKVLGDYNRDNQLTDDDIGSISGIQIYQTLDAYEKFMVQSGKSDLFYKNISWIFQLGGFPLGEVHTKKDLIQGISLHYRGILSFQKGLESISSLGIPLEFVLFYGKDVFSEWKKAQDSVCSDKNIGEMYCGLQEDIRSLPKELKKLYETGKINEKEYKKKKEEFDYIIGNGVLEQSIISQIIPLIPFIAGGYVGGNYQLFYRTGQNPPLSKNVLKSDLNIGIGINNADNSIDKGVFLQGGLGVRIGLDNNGEMLAYIGGIQGGSKVLPIIQLSYRKLVGFEDLEKREIQDLSTTLKSIETGPGIDIFGPYLKFSVQNERVQTIDAKTDLLYKMLEKSPFHESFNLDEYISRLHSYLKQETRLSYLIPMIPAISDTLESLGYDNVNPSEREYVLKQMYTSLVGQFYQYAIRSALTEKHISSFGVKVGLLNRPLLTFSWATKNINPLISAEIPRASLLSSGLIPTKSSVLNPDEMILWMQNILGKEISVQRNKDGTLSIKSNSSGNIQEIFDKKGIAISFSDGVHYSFNGTALILGEFKKIHLDTVYRPSGCLYQIIIGSGRGVLGIVEKQSEELSPFSPTNSIQIEESITTIPGKPYIQKNEAGF